MADLHLTGALSGRHTVPPAPLDPRARIVAALLLSFGMASVSTPLLVPVIVLLAAGLVLAGGGGRQVARGLRAPGLIALAVLVVLPLTAGETMLWQAGPVALRAEGLAAAVLISGRLLAIVAVALALLGPVPPLRLVAGLRGLGLPTLMADLALLTLRYLDDLRAEILRMRLARRLRGGRPGWRALGAEAMLLAAVLIRSQRRAERVWAAMRLRGHGADLAAPLPALTMRDRAAMAAALAAALALAAAGHLA